MRNETWKGHAAIILANVIFGVGVPVTKYLLQQWVTPNTYMAARCIGAAAIFWLLSWLLPKERIERRDLLVIMLAGLLGVVVSQTLTAWALNYTTPVYYSLIASLTPVAVMLMAALFIGEGITLVKSLGVVLGIGGALLMLFYNWQGGSGSNDLLGIGLAILSLLTWAVYLIITRKVSQKYSAVGQMKWVFLVSTIAILPFVGGEWSQARLFDGSCGWDSLSGWGALAFIVLFATVLGYFMVPYAMQTLRATTVSVYTNLQPVVASVVAICVGQDVWSWDKPVAAVLVLLGAYLVTWERTAPPRE